VPFVVGAGLFLATPDAGIVNLALLVVAREPAAGLAEARCVAPAFLLSVTGLPPGRPTATPSRLRCASRMGQVAGHRRGMVGSAHRELGGGHLYRWHRA
jgi:hypothetical protein